MDTGGANGPPFASIGRDFPPNFAKLTSGRRHPKQPTRLWEEQELARVQGRSNHARYVPDLRTLTSSHAGVSHHLPVQASALAR